MKQRSIMLSCGAILMTGAAKAQDLPVVINPFNASNGYMFDWIFFAIMVPIPALLYWDMIRNRNS